MGTGKSRILVAIQVGRDGCNGDAVCELEETVRKNSGGMVRSRTLLAERRKVGTDTSKSMRRVEELYGGFLDSVSVSLGLAIADLLSESRREECS
jgi:hypothetical protein